MLDSGAYTAWTKGREVDLQKYTEFCHEHSEVTYFVNIDVIPGKSNCPPSRAGVEGCCMRGWNNYLHLAKELTPRKVLPVYHMQDDVRWLDKYLSYGCKYIGIGGLAQTRGSERVRFLNTLRKHLFDGAGRPVVKTHGFGITSHDAMQMWEWYSVDSSAWQMMATWGQVMMPRRSNGNWDFTKPPYRVCVTPSSSYATQWDYHVERCNPVIRDIFHQYLDYLKIPVGTYGVFRVKPTHKLDKSMEETWCVKHGSVYRRITEGVSTKYADRYLANALTMQSINKAVSVKRLYLAGPHVQVVIDRERIPYRLLSKAWLKKPSVLKEITSKGVVT